MQFKKVILVIIAIFWTCVQTSPVENEQDCGRKVVDLDLPDNENSLNTNNWPWLVAFTHRVVGSRNFFCGGSLVSVKHVVSGENNVFEISIDYQKFPLIS